jgi:hypothetical protein
VSEVKSIAVVRGAAMGATVKGAPYSAIEVNERTQVLADGTRIHQEHQTKVYRDSEGRVRRETEEQVTIWDPVANLSYMIDPASQTARKAPMQMVRVRNQGPAPASPAGNLPAIRVITRDGMTTATVNGEPADPATAKMLYEKRQAEDAAFEAPGGPVLAAMPVRGEKGTPAQTESLGQQLIEGVNSEGTRSVMRLETGAIGNDRPIQIVNERWYSAELQLPVKTVHNDPRSGEEVFRLTNVVRGEQPAYLFQVPPGYQVLERK